MNKPVKNLRHLDAAARREVDCCLALTDERCPWMDGDGMREESWRVERRVEGGQ